MYKKNIEKFINYKENFNNLKENNMVKNKWVVLLTMCVSPHLGNKLLLGKETEIKKRKELYIKQINSWLSNSNLFIYIVDSSGYEFPEIQRNNDKIKIVSFNLNKDICNNSSECEINSIKYITDQIKLDEKYKKATHILKVTGRYFLQNIESVLEKTSPDLDLYLQYHRNDDIKWQNTEYFGIKKDLLNDFIEKFDKENVIEKNIYNYSLNKKYEFIGKFPNDIRRGGDNLLIIEL